MTGLRAGCDRTVTVALRLLSHTAFPYFRGIAEPRLTRNRGVGEGAGMRVPGPEIPHPNFRSAHGSGEFLSLDDRARPRRFFR